MGNFVPPPAFSAGAGDELFLAWTPRDTGPSAAAPYELDRRGAAGPETKLTPVPVAACCWHDSWPPGDRVP
jgi:hypothetical protein